MKVIVSKNALDYFRKLARNSPNELQCYLLGKVDATKKRIVVEHFIHPRSYAISTKDNVQPTGEEFSRAKLLANELNLGLVGDIHSHPNEQPIMSPADYTAAIEDQLTVCGIVSVYGRRTKVRFWLVNSALPCEVIYAKKVRKK